MTTIKTEDAERLMKRCQVGVGGKNALDAAHGIMAECYGTIGALTQERDSLLRMIAGETAAWRLRFPQYEYRSQDECVALKAERTCAENS